MSNFSRSVGFADIFVFAKFTEVAVDYVFVEACSGTRYTAANLTFFTFVYYVGANT